jgi:ParB/RepB/Spo0J family partition protein
MTTDKIIDLQFAAPQYGNFAINSIRPAANNRQRFDPLKMAELAASIKAKGVIQPIVIRPIDSDDNPAIKYEIVAGERRWRASQIAELETIPAMVRHLSDKEAKEFQVLENLQREDVHPIEEAEGYQELMLKHGYTADELAEQVHKSKAYIYAKLKLCDLSLDARQAMFDEKINASIALLIARIPVPALQAKAMKEVTNNGGRSEPMSYRAAQEHIKNTYMLDLDKAPFPINDAKLIAIVGACTKCPKLTSNQPEVFPDLAGKKICTDPDCFAEKRAANDGRRVIEAHKKGIPVLERDDSEGDALREKTADMSVHDSWCYILQRIKNNGDRYKKLCDLIPDAELPEPALLLSQKDGTVRTFYRDEELQATAERIGICYTEEEIRLAQEEAHRAAEANEAAGIPDPYKERLKQEDEYRAQAAKEQAVRLEIYKRLRHQITGNGGLSIESLRLIANVVYDLGEHIPKQIDELYYTEVGEAETYEQYIATAPTTAIHQFIFDSLFSHAIEVSMWDMKHGTTNDEAWQQVQTLCQAESIDTEFIRAELSAAAKEVVSKIEEVQTEPDNHGDIDVTDDESPTEPAETAQPKTTFIDAWPFPKSKATIDAEQE